MNTNILLKVEFTQSQLNLLSLAMDEFYQTYKEEKEEAILKGNWDKEDDQEPFEFCTETYKSIAKHTLDMGYPNL